ncbi:hypothetical protein L5515_001067 [Caenorhabditis briggsae]|uniref:Uncharacterized protein n=1 Tax=Caenorhabditis briggsae TaxID=6238 RepID=A0AAE9E1R3_CAEBR|nr:hypothetical protein L5515_001067 [Caenorhabditis briggsae]
MENIFSDDDDEYEAFRDQLYEFKAEETVKLVPLFGLYTLVKTTDKEKPREDLFLRGLEPPSNDLDPYKDRHFEHKKVELVKPAFCDNFSFFGMKQNKVKMEASTATKQDHIAERQKLLEKMKNLEKEDIDEQDGEPKPITPTRRPMQPRNSNVDTPIPAQRKRKRRLVLSSDDESDEEYSGKIETDINGRSPRRKRISPPKD